MKRVLSSTFAAVPLNLLNGLGHDLAEMECPKL